MIDFPVLDKGFVRLDGALADDLSVVNGARVSYGKRKEEMNGADEKLIGYLMREKHGSPFEHNFFRFQIKAPIFVAREWMRHRIASYNEMSARYTELGSDWYIPDPENVRVRVGKPGHYEYKMADPDTTKQYLQLLELNCAESYSDYKNALEMGIAPELARLHLHVNHYTEFYFSVNARSLMNFLSLRNASTAQYEIQEYARVLEEIFHTQMPTTYQAFINNERVAP